MATIRTTLLTLFALATPIHSISPPLVPHCLETSLTNTKWVIDALRLNDDPVYPLVHYWLNFWLFNTATEVSANCWGAGRQGEPLHGTCYTGTSYDENGSWLDIVAIGDFTFTGTEQSTQEMEVTQRWSCPGEAGEPIVFTGTANVTLPRRKEAGWVCRTTGSCNYTLPITLTPKVARE